VKEREIVLREEELFVGNGSGFLCVERSGMRERKRVRIREGEGSE
jgi:hypothetical protein